MEALFGPAWIIQGLLAIAAFVLFAVLALVLGDPKYTVPSRGESVDRTSVRRRTPARTFAEPEFRALPEAVSALVRDE